MLKTIFDVNKVKNWPFDLERSSKVKVTKNASIVFKLSRKITKNRLMTNMKKIMSISYIVFAYRKFKVNKDKEENSAMSTEISGSVDTDRCLRSLTEISLPI